MATGKNHQLLVAVLFFVCLQQRSQCRSVSSSGASQADATAMWDLARSLSGLPDSWKPASDPCRWVGVTCSAGRVSGINLASRGVSGTLPSSLGSLSSLASLQLQRNRLSGPLPLLPDLSSLQALSLDENAFDSIPDSFFAGLTALKVVSLNNLPLAPWNLSNDLAAAVGLSDFSASNASLSGTLPDLLGTLPTLKNLRLSYNSLSGSLPSSLAGSSIQQLLLNTQQSPEKLSGRIDVVGAMRQLTVIWLHSNSFSGPIPDLSNLTALESINFRDNSFTGIVPTSLTASPVLKNATLSNNLLQGPYPQFTSSAAVDVGKGNNFCKREPGPCDPRVTTLLAIAGSFGYPTVLAKSWGGDEPCGAHWVGITCDSQSNIVTINFANQHFVGEISPAFANLTSMRQLILSNNNLVGQIPESLTHLPQLQVLDLRNNDLTGKVPAFASSVTLKLEDNPRLGSDSDDYLGVFSSGSKSARSLIAGIVIGVVVLAACAVGIFLCLRRRKRDKKFGRVATDPEAKIGLDGSNNKGKVSGEVYGPATVENTSSNAFKDSGLLMSIQSLKMATNNFSPDNILGRGGFGAVYKGDLNGVLIAVKRNEYDAMGNKGQEEFKSEIDVLRKVKHRNLVSLLGYCDEGQERLLVYEYMPGGTLGEHLFDWSYRNQPPLTWMQRLTIALDVARGIEYLHNLTQESFIHRDLKPSNILLDKEMRAKVSDFGLVKHAADNQKSMMTRLAGTFGYLAPEYALTGKVSTKVDVYAFGVILMELITGRKVLDESLLSEDSHLVALFRKKISQEKDNFLNALVDPVIDLDAEAHKSLMQVAELAWHSTAREPNQRPDICHVVNRLASLIDQWTPRNVIVEDDDDDDDDDNSSMSLSTRLERWQQNDCSLTTGTISSTFKP